MVARAAQLPLEVKAALVVGERFWTTRAVPALGLPSLTLADGPHGVRLVEAGGDDRGLGATVPATCFPPAAGLASSFNPELLERVGAAIGDEARARGVDVVLGPGVNLKRVPQCGRNFEYFSEDPLLTGELGAAWVRGVQSRGVAASVKHFAANNQETARMTVSVEVDERTLRELYLAAFERIVTREQPWTIMCSYNRINGTYAAEHRWLLTEVLRQEWGFEGLVVSDWGAVVDLPRSLAAGLDLEMPGPQPDSVAGVIDAVRSGALAASILDQAIDRVLALIDRVTGDPTPPGPLTPGDHAALAREAAVESIVLLRNEGGVLPLHPDQRIAVVGELARTPRIQGSGSSQVAAPRIDTPLEAIGGLAAIEFAPGYRLDHGEPDPELAAAAVEAAARADAVLLFVGLPEADESEGLDRDSLDLPPAQVELIEAVARANPRTIVLLAAGGVVSLEPWHDLVPAIVQTWLLGQAAGLAIADVVLGRTSPSGRLAESIPLRLQDTSAFLNFPGERDVVRYGEGVFVGYRYYETARIAVRYPFGHGLGYTSFEYTDLVVSRDGARASVTVTNTGSRAGRDVPQLYVASPGDGLAVPVRQLRSFAKVSLEAGESARVEFDLEPRAYQHWDPAVRSWVTPGGVHEVQLGRSSHDIVLTATVRFPHPPPPKLTLDSPVGDFVRHPVTGAVLARASGSAGGADMMMMVSSMPLRRLLRFPGVGRSARTLRVLMVVANIPLVRWIVSRWGGRSR